VSSVSPEVWAGGDLSAEASAALAAAR
jgi:hypothetical protein